MRSAPPQPSRIAAGPLTRAGHSSRAFSLIELLTVVAIIAVLAALLLQTAGYVQDKAARSRTEAEIQAMSTALESYKADNGDYPEGDGSATSTKQLISELCPPSGNDKIYFEIPATMLSTYTKGGDYSAMLSGTLSAANGSLVDAYGNPYLYEYPGDPNRSGTAFFDLYSTGKRTARGSLTQEDWEKQWITNWAN